MKCKLKNKNRIKNMGPAIFQENVFAQIKVVSILTHLLSSCNSSARIKCRILIWSSFCSIEKKSSLLPKLTTLLSNS